MNRTSPVRTGISGLDEILGGGLTAERAYLARGGPGSGKTTLGLHFLTEIDASSRRSLYVTLQEPESKLRENAARQGFDLSNVNFLDLSPSPSLFSENQGYDIFASSEVERGPITAKIVETVERLKPDRVFLDPATQFRYLSADLYQYRLQVLSFLRYMTEQGATVLFTSEDGLEAPDEDLQFMADGVILLENTPAGRYLSVTKLRGSDFKSGRHSMRLTGAGAQVFVRLTPQTAARRQFSADAILSGVPELDEMLNGGLERGTVTILTGPTGAGKTTLGYQFMKECAGRGENSVVYSFEEEIEIMLQRCDQVNIPARRMIDCGTLEVVKVEPLEYSPDEFAYMVRNHVERGGAKLAMIDSLAGYSLSMRGENVVAHLHALVKYLQNMGVAVILIAEISSVVGDFEVTEAGVSYLADNVVFLRYLEMRGELRKAIGVLKKRLSNFEKTLREFEITRYGIKVGKPLTELRGILRGVPEWIGASGSK